MTLNLEMLDRIYGKARKIEDNSKIVTGLVLAQIICRRATLECFDQGSTKCILMAMEEISNTIDTLVKEHEKVD